MEQNEGHDREIQRHGNIIDSGTHEWETLPKQRQNLWLLIIHQIIFRVGWTFKTESVVLPSFLDHLAGPGAGFYRGFLPILSRLGQGILPLAASSTVEVFRHKRSLLSLTTCLLAIPLSFFAMIAMVDGQLSGGFLAAAFLGGYFVFSAVYGIYQVVFNTVQGKLIEPEKRGRLMSYSTFWGTFPAVVAAVFFLRPWLRNGDSRYDIVFLSAAVLFTVSGILCLFLRETHGELFEENTVSRSPFGRMRTPFRCHPNLRKLFVVAMVFSVTLTLTPHYQAFARDQLHIGSNQLFLWVIAQSASVGIFSVLAGALADRYGNRLTLAVLIFGSALAPGWSLTLFYLPGFAESSVWLTFVALAFSTLVPRVAANYALELVPEEDHPIATALLQFGMTLPLFASPVFGQLSESWGFRPLLYGAIVVSVTTGGLTFILPEPRRRIERAEHIGKPITAEE